MQVPAQFRYEKAASLQDAIALLARYGPECRVVAGGHSLIPMMKLRLALPEALVDINDLTELGLISLHSGELRIGALVRHADLLASPKVGALFRIFHDAERVIADPVVRNRGTIGGSLCQADPSEDLSAVFAAVGATAAIRGADGERLVPVREFFAGPYRTAVGDGEVLAELRVPIRPVGSAYHKVRRRAGDWAVAAVGAVLALDGETISEAGIGLTAVGAAQFFVPEAEEFLRGGPATAERFAEAGGIVRECCSPSADQRGPADYKRHVAGELTVRALHTALARWHGSPEEA